MHYWLCQHLASNHNVTPYTISIGLDKYIRRETSEAPCGKIGLNVTMNVGQEQQQHLQLGQEVISYIVDACVCARANKLSHLLYKLVRMAFS